MAEDAKARGNELYSAGKHKEALAAYQEALKASTSSSEKTLRGNVHKNMAACHLKLKNYQAAVDACTAALELLPNDTKALYRRSQAYEQLNNLDDAFADAATAARIDPKNTAAAKAATRLLPKVSSKIDQQRSSQGIAQKLLEKVLTASSAGDRLDYTKKLVAFARDNEANAAKLFHSNGAGQLLPLLDRSADEPELVAAVLHVLAALAENSGRRALQLLELLETKLTREKLQALLHSPAVRVARAAIQILNSMVLALTDVNRSPAERAGMEKVLDYVVALVGSRNISAEGRDSAISIVINNAKTLNVGRAFLDRGGVRALVNLAAKSMSPLHTAQTADSGLAMSDDVRMNISVALQQVFEATKQKGGVPDEEFVDACIRDINFVDDPVGNIPPVYAMTTIIQAVPEVGNQVLEKEGVMDKLMVMAQSENRDAQCAAAEALAHAASDKKRAKVVLQEGFNLLKALYAKDLPDSIRVRALCGICKLSSRDAGAPNLRPLSQESMINLAKKLRPFLVDSGRSMDCRKWATEGLAYLSLDADVKEFVVNDDEVLKAIRTVCIDGDKTVCYGVAMMLVNVTNTFDKPAKKPEEEEMRKLGKFAGEHIPEPHPMDSEEATKARVQKLVDSDMGPAMVQLCRSESELARDAVSRVFHGLVMDQKNRGKIVQCGGARCLLQLARENNTDKGKLQAAQALAKIAITSDPSVSFPGQRALELVRPLVRLLRDSDHELPQFEAAMALTNLAGMSDEMRARIKREEGVRFLEDMMFAENPLCRRAGTEAMCNMLMNEEVFGFFATPKGAAWERVKLWILLSGVADEDLPTAVAASGGLAQLSHSPDVCKRIKEEKQGIQIMKELLLTGDERLQMRAVYIVRNMVTQDKELAEAVIGEDEEGLRVLTLLAQAADFPGVRNGCEEILEIMAGYGLIKRAPKSSQREAMQSFAKLRAEILERVQAEREREEGPAEDEEEEAAVDEQEEEESEEDVDAKLAQAGTFEELPDSDAAEKRKQEVLKKLDEAKRMAELRADQEKKAAEVRAITNPKIDASIEDDDDE